MSELLLHRVRRQLETLKLTTARERLDEHLQRAAQRELSHLDVLDSLLGDELALRAERGLVTRTKLAHFPTLKSLDTFDIDAQPSLDRKALTELRNMAFIERAENVVLLGPPGVGKTHLAIGLGLRAVQAGYRTYFVTAQDLLDLIRIAQLDGIPGHKQRHLVNVPLLIIDEIGYVQFDRPAATWLFQLIERRYERHSTIVTSNKSFADWSDILGDTTMAGALLDRLLHHSHVLNLKGESYRLRKRKGGASASTP
ncbi:MAG TPA: IS21-like element helper ATPase IstB [Candidatus Dormibacteraeota bacterium]|nr:IS21-like element helper ATPase IstB [Candidatus Dormibacteraeota bacterium]